MGRLTVKGVAEQLRKYYGIQSNVARAYGVTPSAVSQYISKHPELQAVVAECEDTILDIGESALYASVIEKDPWAVKFLLSTKGKRRGYVERTEHEVSGRGGKPIEVRAIDYRQAIGPLAPEGGDE